MHPITRARAFRPFALNAVFRSVTIIGLANVSSRILECLSVCESKKGYSSSASARPLYLQPLIRLPLMFQASHFEPSFCQRDEAAHSRERSFQRRSSMRHVTIILNNLPTKEYKVDSYVNAYPLFSRPIPPLPLLPIRRFVLHRFLPFRAFDRLRFSLSLSLSLFLFSRLLFRLSSFVFTRSFIFRRFIFIQFSFVFRLRYTLCLRFMFAFIIALLRFIFFPF